MNATNRKKQAGGKLFVFLSGVLVGTVIVSLVFVNVYTSSRIERSLLSSSQKCKYDSFTESNQSRRQQLRADITTVSQHDKIDDSRFSASVVAPEKSVIVDNEKSSKNLTVSKNHTKNLEKRPIEGESSLVPSFFELARQTGTDKVKGVAYLPACLESDSTCTRPSCERERCRPWGHFYHTMYQQKFSKFLNLRESFQLVEIGYNLGFGYDTYKMFFEDVPGAELHSIEISCIEEGPREEGKWPWGNFAKENKEYESLLERNLLHCGDASDVNWLYEIWNQKMYRRKQKLTDGSVSSESPPLKIVVDDGSHLAKHMVHSMFFWFPRIEPGGILIVEDVQPISEANLFRTQFLPQIMADLHFCGDPKEARDEACFPQLYPLLQSIHCEMHICVFERNEQPAIPDLSVEESMPPPNALDLNQCFTFANVFGTGMEVT